MITNNCYDSYLNQDINSHATVNTENLPSLETLVCTKTIQNIQELLEIVIPILENHIQYYPQDEYSKLYFNWFDKGLTAKSTLQDLLNIT
jgi:hypothetical protein